MPQRIVPQIVSLPQDGNSTDCPFNFRITKFSKSFREQTGTSLDYIICAPGRVNLIGDHIDYHGFPVLPMAISNDIWLGCSFEAKSTTDTDKQIVSISNVNSKQYPSFSGAHTFEWGSKLSSDIGWHHYILCGYHGILANRLLNVVPNEVLEHANRGVQSGDDALGKLGNFHIFVDGDLPPASGLSSSSALVCASAIATCLFVQCAIQEDSKECPHVANSDLGVSFDANELAESCSKFEHLVGTRGGGMDQAVIMTADEGYAKYIEFMPKFFCRNVCLPDGIDWLVSHCGSDYQKAATSGFNTRVLETKLGAAMIAKAHNCNKFPLDRSLTLGKVKQELFAGETVCNVVKHLRDKVFEKNKYTIEEICTRLGMTRAQLRDNFGVDENFLSETLNDQVTVLTRCEHVFEEAERVQMFRSICESSSNIELLGKLMTQSHYSLRDKYECSHVSLDKLVDVALKAGALGARLTGAGWGGCMVALVARENSNSTLESMRKISRFSFRTEPMSGCRIIKLNF